MFIYGNGNWVKKLNDAVITYNNNIHSTINMTPVDASNNPDKVIDISGNLLRRLYLLLLRLNQNLKMVIMLEMRINVKSFPRVTLLIGIEVTLLIGNYLKLMKF